MTDPKFAAAFAKMQQALPKVEPDSVNPHFKSKFVSLDHLIAKTRPVLNAHGFSISQFPSHIKGQPALATIIQHETGSWEDKMPLILGKNDMQGLGGALTYARRYAWAAALGISADEDDDANQASAAIRTDGKIPAKPAKTFAEWVKRMSSLEVRHPEEWARLYTEASGTDRKLVLQRLNTVLLDLTDGEPPYEAFMEGWRERLQGAFSRAFGGVVVDGPADEPVSASPPAARPRDEEQAKWEEGTPF